MFSSGKHLVSFTIGALATLLVLGMVSSITAQEPKVERSPDRQAAGPGGTFEVWICKGPCDPSRADSTLTRGYLVIEDQRYSFDEVALPAEEPHIRGRYLVLMGDIDRRPNACFQFQRTRGAQTYAGIQAVGFTAWENADSGQITIPLYRSPDSGYGAVLRRDGDTLAGRGKSWGAKEWIGGGPGRVDWPADSIYARRIGAPDRARCIRDAGEDLVRWRTEMERARIEYQTQKAARDSAVRSRP